MVKYRIMRQFVGMRTGGENYYWYIVEVKKSGLFSGGWQLCKILDSEEAAMEFMKTKPDPNRLDKPTQIYP